MAKAAKKLKGALQAQQSRLKAKQKISHAAQVAEQKSTRKKGQASIAATTARAGSSKDVKGKGKATPGSSSRPTIPFSPTDKILLIGEGNFSYALSMVQDAPVQLATMPPSNLCATAYDTEEECYAKYPEAQAIVSSLKEKGVQVLFGVDGTALEKNSRLKGRRWDKIVWNFPHAGKGIADQDRNILSNQMMILGFLRSAAKILQLGPAPSFSLAKKKKKSSEDDEEEDEIPVADVQENPEDADETYKFFTPSQTVQTQGTVLITLRNVVPYTQWDVPRLAKNPPVLQNGNVPPNPRYTLLRSFKFHREIWKGYEHRMTKGERAHGKGTTGEGGEDRTWEFCLKDETES
ncbi:hypothetical protein D9613_004073 [Agrocybe pediades]|uniref:25S rRNA (uridine-N(3))-methyltransferase BMT5-like domain-containing protein n=1 Tax=Agrocybe pediades TaxID=84607 RepID=A0A8H4VIN2_9AGAR|nr:hypothetical protein D9613_004073 [Agrocybe pediades]